MTYHGTVKNGVVVLDEGASLSDGTVVRVETVSETGGEPTLYEQLQSVIGIAKDLPPDLAAQHDHYLHGRPKK
jgi:wyosine [tRNA(Phe)-imidazoG37] synthetase (radical SAM superfamily)